MMDSLLQDIRFGMKLMYKNLKFSTVIILCLALGIGPNATIFSVVNTLILTPPDVAEPDRMVYVNTIDLRESDPRPSNLSFPYFQYLQQETTTLEHIAVETMTQTTVVLPEGSVFSNSHAVSSNFFDLLGREPLLGTVFHQEEQEFPGAHPYMVLGYHFWKDKLNGDKNIIGKTLLVNSYEYQVLGVMPESFTGSICNYQPDFWSPIMMVDQLRPGTTRRLEEEGHRWLMAYGRMKEGVSMARVGEELTSIAGALSNSNPETYQDLGLSVTTYDGLAGAPKTMVRGVTALLFGVVAVVLLVACSSVAALLLARSTARRREISIRLAMGATRKRLIRMLLVESMLLAMIAGVFALLLTLWTLDLVFAMIPTDTLPLYLQSSLDPRVLGFTLLVSLGSGFFFGLAPALQSTKPDLMSALKDQPISGGLEKRVSRMRSAFIVAQFACSMLLLIMAGLFVKSLYHAHKVDPGFKTSNLMDYHFEPGLQGYVGLDTGPLAQSLKKRVEETPGVQSVALARLGPLPTHRTGTFVTPMNEDLTTGERIILKYNYVGSGYFSTMEIPILKGRGFNHDDSGPWSASVIVNETFAKMAWPNQDPINQYVGVPWSSEIARVVGVAKDARYYALGEDTQPYIYFPMARNFGHELSLIISCDKDPELLRADIEAAIKAEDENLLLSGLTTVDQVINRSLWPARVAAILFGVLGFLALILAVIGIYGVMSYSVNLRRQEVGIRMALGGAPGDLVLLLMKRGLLLIGGGGILGLGLALAVTHLLKDLLSGMNHMDPAVFILIPILLTLTAGLSIYFPARKTTRINPMESLRYE